MSAITKASSFFLIAAFAAAAAAYCFCRDSEEQVSFLTHFYKGYFAHLGKGNQTYTDSSAIYSKSAKILLAENSDLCNKLSRGDDICGYSADGDSILNTQETAPELNFENASFDVHSSGWKTVDVSFSIWPAQGSDAARTIRYVMVKENDGWRVDDVFFGAIGRFPIRESLRQQINDENAKIRSEAKNLGDVIRWMLVYLDEPMPERFERFVRLPLQICEMDGRCSQLRDRDGGLPKLAVDLHFAFLLTLGQTAGATLRDHRLADEVSGWSDPASGSTARCGPLELAYLDDAWWLVKVDFARIESPAPGLIVFNHVGTRCHLHDDSLVIPRSHDREPRESVHSGRRS